MWTSGFALENERGERYDLTASAPIYLVNVEGLGAAYNPTYGDLGGGFYRLLDNGDPQNGITGDLIYQAGAFANYQALVNWIMRAETLYFCYTPLDVEYRRRVRLNYIVKDKRDSAGWMRAVVSFDPLTPWYLPSPAEIGIAEDTGDTKTYLELDGGEYGYTYSDTLTYGGEAAGSMEALLMPAGHEPAAIVLRYTGAITNPRIRLVGATSGTVYGICDLEVTLGASDMLELSTLYDNSYVKKISAGGAEESLLENLNLAFDPYFHAPVTEPSVLSIESDAAVLGGAELLVYTYYRSV